MEILEGKISQATEKFMKFSSCGLLATQLDRRHLSGHALLALVEKFKIFTSSAWPVGSADSGGKSGKLLLLKTVTLLLLLLFLRLKDTLQQSLQISYLVPPPGMDRTAESEPHRHSCSSRLQNSGRTCESVTQIFQHCSFTRFRLFREMRSNLP